METSNKYEIGQRVRLMRQKEGYTIEALAGKANISSRFLTDIENGNKGTSADTLIRLSTALRVSVDYLLFGREVDSTCIEQAIARFDSTEQKLIKMLFLHTIKILDVAAKEK